MNRNVHQPKQKEKKRKHKWKFRYNKKNPSTTQNGLSFSLQLFSSHQDDLKSIPKDSEGDLLLDTDSDSMPEVLDQMEEEIERQLEEKAEKTNLTVANVKNMLKAVITNSGVMDMVNYSLQRSTEKPVFEPKLTRARKKELMARESIVMSEKESSDLGTLITQDLTEDSSDEEYKPQDDWSDDESKLSEGFAIEDDILIKNNDTTTEDSIMNKTNSLENIGQRTRSKFSLSETALETIEQSFVPPDITTDMYNTDCDNQDWANFLKEFMQPLDANINETIDDENDPEYNVMVDEEHERPDIEELRMDRAVKVTKKELNDLMSELFEYTNLMSSDDEDVKKKKDREPLERDETLDNIKKNTHNIHSNSFDLVTSIPENKLTPCLSQCQFFFPLQVKLLQQQMRQHVQLTLQGYLLSCGNTALPEFYSYGFKKILVEIYHLSNVKTNTFFKPINLTPALQLVAEWENTVQDETISQKLSRFIELEYKKLDENKRRKKFDYFPKLPQILLKLCFNSTSFVYPLLLPRQMFLPHQSKFNHFTNSENLLVAMGLEQFVEHMKNNRDVFKKFTLQDVANFISVLMMPSKSVHRIYSHINRMRIKPNNPISFFYQVGRAPEASHYIIPFTNETKKLCDQPSELLPQNWSEFREILLEH